MVKVCVRPDAADRTDRISVEGDIMFDPNNTQPEELDALVTRTVVAAGILANRLIEHDEFRGPDRNTNMKDLLARIDDLSQRKGRLWVREGDRIRVTLRDGGRSQTIHVSRIDNRYVFRSVVLPASEVTWDDDHWRDLAYRAWRRNASKALVTFAFDANDRLVGLIQVPAATLDHEELDLYVDTLAKECDRFEYALTGHDVE